MSRFNHVLLVEDDPITILVCERIISLTGFSSRIVSVNNGQEALDYITQKVQLAEELPDIIFLDINMPIMNGWEFLDTLSTAHPNLQNVPPIYILSSTVDPADESKGMSYPHVKNFLSKPLTKEHLEQIETEAL